MSAVDVERVADAAQHLTTELKKVLVRHMLIMKGGGATATEGCAATCMAVEELAYAGLGASAIGVRGDQREQYLQSVETLCRHLRSRADTFVADVEEALA